MVNLQGTVMSVYFGIANDMRFLANGPGHTNCIFIAVLPRDVTEAMEPEAHTRGALNF